MTRHTTLKILLILLAMSLGNTAMAANTADQQLRITRSIDGTAKLPAEALSQALENTEPLVELPLSTTPRETTPPKTLRSLYSYAYWIRDLYTAVEYDDDFDGYYQRLTLNFQPDLDVGSADIYADIYISYENTQWDFLATTSSYPVYAGADNDYFRVTVQLDSGYPTGYYDLLIELHDARSGRLLASYGPNDALALDDLPLEDARRDSYYGSSTHTDVYIAGGGALGGLGLSLLGGLLLIRRRLRPATTR